MPFVVGIDLVSRDEVREAVEAHGERYLERIYKWAKRVGLDEIRRQIMGDLEKRQGYYDRFVFSQRFAQVDPWSERVSGKDKHEFRPMATIGFPQAAE